MDPVLSILIVNWNTRALLLDCLRSLAAAHLGVATEILVVDNASGDGSAQAVRDEFPQVTVIANADNLGFAAANNQAYGVARGRYVLLLNSDTTVAPGQLDQLVAFLDANPRAGIVGPQLLNPDGSFQISALRFARPWDVFYEFARFPRLLQPASQKNPRRLIPLDERAATEVDYVMGAALLIRRSAVEAIGLMDEAYFMYAEEVDWCYRAKAAGWGVFYLPTATVVHYGGQSTNQVPARMLAHRFVSTFRFMGKHYGAGAVALTRLLLAWAAVQNTLLALAWRAAGKRDAEPLTDVARRNGVVWRTALTGAVPKALR